MHRTDLLPGLKDYPLRRFKRGSTILYQGEIPRSVYVVKSGVVKVYNINTLGEEQIIAFQTSGDIFPTQWTFQISANALYYYEALTDVELYAMTRQECRDIIDESPLIMKQTMQYYIDNYTHVLMRVNALEQTRASDKIMHTLYGLMIQYGEETTPGWYEIILPLSHQNIADMVGLTRETTSLELSKLRKENVIQYQGKLYSIHRDRLGNLIGEDNFREMNKKA